MIQYIQSRQQDLFGIFVRLDKLMILFICHLIFTLSLAFQPPSHYLPMILEKYVQTMDYFL